MPLWKHLYLETLKEYVQNRFNITLSLTVTIKLIICFFFFSLWLSPLNTDFISVADFPFIKHFKPQHNQPTFIKPFQMPCLSELHYNSIYKYPVGISFIYYSNLKILPNSIFSIFLFCPLWRPIIILHLVSSLGYITLSIGYNIQSKKISNDQELIQSDPTSCPQNQKGNN